MPLPSARREVIDVHAHCFTARGLTREVGQALARARAGGVSHVVVVGLVNRALDAEAMWDLMPRSVVNRGDPGFWEAEDLLGLAQDHAPTLLPFVDTRHLTGDVEVVLGDLVARGFRGIKGLYLPDEGNDLGVRSIPAALGISAEAYRRREWEVFAFAEARGLPVVYHMDARRHRDAMEAILADFPRLRIDFAHLGISRKAFGPILDRHPNAFTDLASLLPHVRQDPRGYRDFLLAHADRVCFGSDAFLYAADEALEYVRMVDDLDLPGSVTQQVFSTNPRRFLGASLGGAPAEGLP